MKNITEAVLDFISSYATIFLYKLCVVMWTHNILVIRDLVLPNVQIQGCGKLYIFIEHCAKFMRIERSLFSQLS